MQALSQDSTACGEKVFHTLPSLKQVIHSSQIKLHTWSFVFRIRFPKITFQFDKKVFWNSFPENIITRMFVVTQRIIWKIVWELFFLGQIPSQLHKKGGQNQFREAARLHQFVTYFPDVQKSTFDLLFICFSFFGVLGRLGGAPPQRIKFAIMSGVQCSLLQRSGTKNQPKDRSFRPDVPADIRPKTSVRLSKSWKNKHFGTDMPRGRPRKNFGLKNFGLIFRSLRERLHERCRQCCAEHRGRQSQARSGNEGCPRLASLEMDPAGSRRLGWLLGYFLFFPPFQGMGGGKGQKGGGLSLKSEEIGEKRGGEGG